MSYEMRLLRKEDLSLYYYIKDIVMRNFVEEEKGVPLRLLPEMCGFDSYVYEYNSSLEPSPTERGRGWRYFDPTVSGTNCEPFTVFSGTNAAGVTASGTPEQISQVVVYSSGVKVDAGDYMIDYVDGRIITQFQLISPTVDFHWNYVSVVDEWAAIEAADPPVVVIDMHGTDKAGYQLGGGRKTTRKIDIHIFASNTAERNDIVETIYDGLYLKSCPIYDFPTGTVLDYDGTFYGRKSVDFNPFLSELENKLTYLFDRKKVSNVSSLQFDSVTARHVNLPLVMSRGRDEVMLSDLNAYRSKVSFDMISYDDRIAVSNW